MLFVNEKAFTEEPNNTIMQQLILLLLILKKIIHLVFENNDPFINCVSKINGVKIDNAEDVDVVMSMYNVLEYSKNYRKTITIEMNQMMVQMIII